MSDDPEGIADDPEEGGGGSPPWMATFADLSTLLLTFFVLLLSFSTMDIGKYKQLLDSVHTAFGSKQIHEGSIQDLTTSIVKISELESTTSLSTEDLNLRAREREVRTQMLSRLRGFVSDQNLETSVEASEGDGVVVVRMPGEALFDAGSADLRPEALVLLREMADMVDSFPYQLAVEGHTDDQRTSGEFFESNWDLSAARAISVVRFLIEAGRVEPRRLSVAGYGGARPIAPNDSPAGRARNRRVEFVFHNRTATPPADLDL